MESVVACAAAAVRLFLLALPPAVLAAVLAAPAFAQADPPVAVFISDSPGGMISAGWSGNANVQNEGTVPHGTRVTFTATPDPGHQFSGWTGDCAGAANPCVREATANVRVGAAFCTKSLDAAIDDGDLAQVQCHLDGGVDINAGVSTNSRTRLHWAVINRRPQNVRLLLMVAGIDPNRQDGVFGSNPLIESAFTDQADITGILANHPLVSLNIASNSGNTALHTAAERGHLAVVNTLLAAGAEVNPPANNAGRTPLGEALVNHHLEVAARLLAAGGNHGTDCVANEVANPNSATPPCLVPATTPQKVFISEATGGTVSAGWSGGSDLASGEAVPAGATVTFRAAAGAGGRLKQWGDACAGRLVSPPECVWNVLAAVTVSAVFECTGPFQNAARFGDIPVASCHLEHGADVNAGVATRSRTPLHWAVIGVRPEMVRFLLAVPGVDVNKSDTINGNPLVAAGHAGNAEVAGLLANHPGIILDAADGNGNTGLHLAAAGGHLAVVNTLLAAGAMVNTLNVAGRTALGEARNANHDAIALRLLGAGGHYGTACGAGQAVNPDSATPPCVAGAAVFISVSANGTVSAEWFADADLQNEDAVPLGTTVTFTASPAADYYVSGWSGDCEPVGQAGAFDAAGAPRMCELPVMKNVTVGAVFAAGCAKSLRVAALDGDLSQVQCNFNLGADVNGRAGSNNRVPLHWAVIGQQAETVRELLMASGIDPNLQDTTYGSNALIESAFQGYDEIAGILANHSLVNLNITDNNDNTALHTAAARGHLAVVNTLLAAGAEVNPPVNTAGRTPLGEAQGAGHEAVAIRLADAGGRYGATSAARVFISETTGGTVLAGRTGDANVRDREPVPAGATVTFTATPDANSDYYVSGWSGDCEPVGQAGVYDAVGAPQLCELPVTANVTVGAVFEEGCAKPLEVAARQGDLAQVQCNFIAGAGVNDRGGANNRVPLHWAVIGQQAETVRDLLTVAGIDPNLQDTTYGSNPLIEAAFQGYDEIAGILANHSLVSLNITDNNDNTALHTAAARGHLAVVNTLLAAGALVNPPPNSAGRTPLGEAQNAGHQAIVFRLIEAGGHYGTACGEGEKANPISPTPPCVAGAAVFISVSANGTVSAEWLGDADLQNEDTVPAGTTVTFTATPDSDYYVSAWTGGCESVGQTSNFDAAGAPRMCELPVTVNVTVGAVFEEGCAKPLVVAARQGDQAQVQCNLDAGADVNGRAGHNNRAPLHWAVIGQQLEMVRLLLAVAGIDPNVQDTTFGSNALLHSAFNGNAEIAGILANHAAVDLERADNAASTALHTAAVRGHLAVVNTLLAAGANVNPPPNDDNRTPLGEAQNGGHDAIVRRLIEAGGHYGTACDAGETANPASATPPCVAGVAVFISEATGGTVSAGWSGDAEVQSADPVPVGTTVTFTATPDPDYQFFGWTGACAGAANPCAREVTAAVTVGADFREICTKSLVAAARQGDLAQVQCNFIAGAGVNDRGGANNRVPLHWAVIGQQAETVRDLLTVAGIDPNLQDTTYGSNPLIEAAFQGYDEIAGILANHSLVSLNITDNNDNTALHTAAARGHLAVVNTLLAAGAEVNPPPNTAGRTPLGEARNAGHQAIADRLIEVGGHYGTACPGQAVNPAAATPPCLAQIFITDSANGTVSAEWSGDANLQNEGTVPPGTTVTFTATPDSDYEFSAWTGACADEANPCALGVSVNVTVGADFAPEASPEGFTAAELHEYYFPAATPQLRCRYNQDFRLYEVSQGGTPIGTACVDEANVTDPLCFEPYADFDRLQSLSATRIAGSGFIADLTAPICSESQIFAPCLDSQGELDENRPAAQGPFNFVAATCPLDDFYAAHVAKGGTDPRPPPQVSYSKLPGGHAGNGGTLAEADGRASGFEVAAGATVTFTAAPNPGWTVTWNDESGCDGGVTVCEVVVAADVNLTAIFGTGDDALLEKYFPGGGNQHCATVGGNTDPLTHPGSGSDVIGRECFGVSVGETACVQLGESFDPSRDIWNSNGDILNDYSSGIPPICSEEYPDCVLPEERVVSGNPFSGCAVPSTTRQVSYSKLPGGHAGNGGAVTVVGQERDAPFEVAAGATVTFTATPNPGWTVTWNDESGCDDEELTCEVIVSENVNVTAIFGTGDDALVDKYFPPSGRGRFCETLGGAYRAFLIYENSAAPQPEVGRLCYNNLYVFDCMQLGNSYNPAFGLNEGDEGDLFGDPSAPPPLRQTYPPLCSEKYPDCDGGQVKQDENLFGACVAPSPPVTVFISTSANGIVSAEWSGDSDVQDEETVPHRTAVTFTASPDSDFYVVGWSGDCKGVGEAGGAPGASRTCELTARKNVTVGAVFVRAATVFISTSANGTVSAEWSGDADLQNGEPVPAGTTVTFTAEPAANFYVSGWSGGCDGVGAAGGFNAPGTPQPCELGVGADVTVGAVFTLGLVCDSGFVIENGECVLDPAALYEHYFPAADRVSKCQNFSGDNEVAVEVRDPGAADTTADVAYICHTKPPSDPNRDVCYQREDGDHAAGLVGLRTHPGAYNFTSADTPPPVCSELFPPCLDASGALDDGQNPFADNCTGMPPAPVSVFISAAANGTVSAEWSGDAEVLDGETVPHRTAVTFTATPDLGYEISMWSGACDGALKTETQCVATATENLRVSVLFADLDECAAATHDCTAANAVCANTPGDFVCECASGYSGDGLTCDSDKTTEISPVENGSLSASPSGSPVSHGTTVTFTAEPDSGYEISEWFDACDGTPKTESKCVATATVNLKVSVAFADLDECAAETHDCAPTGGVCTNTAGAYECSCGPGFSGDGRDCGGGDRRVSLLASENGSLSAEPGRALVANGTTVTFTATPDSGYEISLWLADCAGASGPTCALPVTMDVSVGVEFADIDECARATDDCAPTESGGICTNTPGDFVCECDSGYSGDGLTCDSDKTTEISPVENGSLSASPSGSPVSHGTTVTFTAEPNSGYEISEWFGACDGTAKTESKCVATATVNLKVSVSFGDIDECATATDDCAADGGVCTNTPGDFACECDSGYSGNGLVCESDKAVEISPVENGSLSASPSESPVSHGTTVTFTAEPDSGYEISEWFDACDGTPKTESKCVATATVNLKVSVSFADVDECATATHDCTAANAVCANTPGDFVCECDSGYSGNGLVCDSDKAVEISSVGNGSLSASPSGSPVPHGTTVTFTASPNSGYEISEWSGACDDTPITESKCVATATVNLKVSVAFADLDECARETHGCAPTGGVCTNTAGAYECSCGPGFSGDGRDCGGGDRRVSLLASENGSLSAEPGRALVANGTTVTFTATPDSGYEISLWLEDCAGASGPRCALPVTMDVSVGVSFADVDECATATDNCAADGGICTNTPGDFVCECDSGYSGDGLVCDSDKTTEISSVANGSLSASPSESPVSHGTTVTFTASPDSGYEISEWSGACDGTAKTESKCVAPATVNLKVSVAFSDIDECATALHNCAPTESGGVCKNTPGDFACECASGYSGNGLTCEADGEADKRISLSASEGGTVFANPAGPAVAHGTTVTFTTTPAAGHRFSLWLGDCADAAAKAECVLTATVNVNVSAEFGCLDFHESAMAGDVAGLECNLSRPDADADAPNAAGATPLMVAVSLGHSAAAEALLDAGAQATLRDAAGRTVLDYAPRAAGRGLVRRLIGLGAAYGAADCESPQVVNPQPGGAPCADCPAGEREVNGLCIDEAAPLLKDASTCRDVFRGEWVQIQPGAGICSEIDINDTFCIGEVDAASPLSCLGLFNHVRSCNMVGRPALDPWHCAAACPSGRAAGARCLAE